jgi:hypothetical protein
MSEIGERFPVPAGGCEKTAGMHRKLARAGLDLARPYGVENRPIGLSRGGERAARMAVPGRPARTMLEQALIGHRRLLMALAIAEQPCAEISDRLLLGLQSEGGARAIERFLTPIAVIKSFAQTAIERRPLVVGHLALPQRDAAGSEVAGAQRALSKSGARGLFR